MADKLAVHGIAGFIESFYGDYVCRLCLAKSCDIKSHVASGVFCLRSKEDHAEHVKIANETSTHYLGVKQECVFTRTLSHFHVVTGFLPDIAHDKFEGIIPVELAQCQWHH